MTDKHRDPKRVFCSDEDQGFISVAPDLPGCSAFGETEREAIAELDDAIVAWIAAAAATGNIVALPSVKSSPVARASTA